jgi:hypothetical protein
MEPAATSVLAADLLLIGHFLFVLFVLFGFALVLIGAALCWRWVRNPWFRLAHVVAIGVVTLQSWAGVICPLTTWEMALREGAGEGVYSGTFISHWLESLLYYRAPAWVFTVCYTMFALAVVASWFWVRPRPFRKRRRPRDAA